MKIIKTEIKGLLIIEPRVFEDERGYFFESWSKDAFQNVGLDINFVQDNESLSSEGVVRGLHFQNPPFAQGKLVRVLKGSVLDVAVDIRKNSPTYGKHVSAHLSEENKTMFWIPPGFAHGFSTLENNTIFSYKCSGVYNKESEGSLMWNDTDLNIDWKIKNPIISEKDQNSALFTNFKSLF
ncbi:MAG: dTDP-4-dehydrorhamnose 3,5-epimerase [Flavobacteriales bacterium]|nr:dTDP-4-dehydrorhamnose 3,5-epimerase [Flavobacteriales bacterium]